MKKETVIAILFGIILGGVLAVVIITKNKQTKLENSKTIAPVAKISPVSSASITNVQTLEISSPEDGDIVDKNTITIKAKADKDALVIIQSPVKDLSIRNDKTNFETDFPLALGENIIKIVVYPKDNQLKPQEKELKIYYIDEQL